MTLLSRPFESIDIGENLVSVRELPAPSRKCLRSQGGKNPIIGNSQLLKNVVSQAEAVAMTDSTVLILGETGTGKELLAQHMHRMSQRSSEPFVITNVAAIPATLLESELFGRERGAYTGAMSRQMGRFEMANGGTLFLDEIGEMPVESQVKLLRVLETGGLERLGSSRTFHVDVRVIAATNRKMPDLMQSGAFRQDLYYRLNVFPLTMPPLRERPEDIPALIWAFVKEFSFKMGKAIERIREEDLDALNHHAWPGNVRELRNVVERSMILTSGPELRLALPSCDALGCIPTASRLLRDVEHAHISQVLKSTRGRIRGKAGAAEILGLKPTTLYSLMHRLGVERTH
jgi:transcriptional regulator with GAF, ATPase, and Fis domain